MRSKKLHNFEESDGSTLVHCAVKYKNVDLMTYFIKNDWELDTENKNLKTPIMIAIENQHDEMISLLLQHNVNIEHNSSGQSILKLLLEQQPTKNQVMLFIKKYFDKYPFPVLAKRLFQLECPLPYVIFLNDERLTKKMLELGSPINSTINGGMTALHVAASLGDLSNIELLVKAGADISVNDELQNTALNLYTFNIHENSEQILELLASNRNNLITKNMFGICPLFTGMINGDKNITKKILNMDIDFTVTDTTGNTFLFFFVQNQNESVFEDLEEFSMDIIDVRNYYGETPMHIAAPIGCIQAIDFLIKSKMNPSVKTHNGDTALNVLDRYNETCQVENYKERREKLTQWELKHIKND